MQKFAEAVGLLTGAGMIFYAMYQRMDCWGLVVLAGMVIILTILNRPDKVA